MICRSLISLLMTVAVIAPASAQQAPSATSAKAAAVDPNKRICENIYLDSRVRMRRFCGTRAEWEALRQADRQDVEKMQRPMQCNAIMGKSC
jgi:hypothetical protein